MLLPTGRPTLGGSHYNGYGRVLQYIAYFATWLACVSVCQMEDIVATSSDQPDPYDLILIELNMPRTRENYLWVKYDGNVPEELWDDDAEMELPADLRL